MAAHSPSSPAIQPVLPDQPQAAWAPWLREIAGAVNQLGAKTTELAAGGGGATGPAGPPGPAGPTGPTGPAGSANMSGMVAGQIPIAATATSVTSSTASLAASFMPAYTGDVTSPAGSAVNTLATVNSNVGTFQGITVNGKGLVTAAANQSYLTANQTITLSGDVSGSGTTAITTTLATVPVAKGGTNKTSWTTGSVVFAGSTTALQEDNANLFWDDTNNRLGIGTAIPSRRLVVSGTGASIGVTDGNELSISPPAAASASLAQIDVAGNNDLRFNTNSGERLRILANGNFGVGTAGPQFKLHAATSAAAQYVAAVTNTNNTPGDKGIGVCVGPSGTGDTGSTMIGFIDQGFTTNYGAITRNGVGVTYGTASDARLKEDIQDSDTGLEFLLNLKVRDFKFKGGERGHGFVAQELHEHYPAAVGVGGDDPRMEPWTVDYGRITPLLVRAIQQQQAQIDRLLDLLEGRGAR